MPDFKDRGGYQRQVYDAMKLAGINADAIYAAMGVPLDQVLAPDYSYSHRAAVYFWSVAEKQSGDPDVGLTVGQHLPGFRGQVLQYLHQSSPTFGEGLRRSLAYQRLVSDALVVELVEGEDGTWVSQMSQDAEINQLLHVCECMSCGFIRYFQLITDGRFVPTRLEFSCPPPQDVTKRERLFNCPVSYHCPENRIHFDPALMALPLPSAEPELFSLHERLAAKRLHEIASLDVIDAIHRQIGALLESGQAEPEQVAKRMGISSNKLATRLSDAGTSFNRELDAYRDRLARHLLANTDEPISEICYLTNFSEPSAFYRAFKRWRKGETPMEYRNRKRGAKDLNTDTPPQLDERRNSVRSD